MKASLMHIKSLLIPLPISYMFASLTYPIFYLDIFLNYSKNSSDDSAKII